MINAEKQKIKNSHVDSFFPRISIVMAAYNEERDIKKALDSILAQTFTDWELIIIDDGSTDTTARIIESYRDKDSRIKLFCNDTNRELSASLNKGIRLARADLSQGRMPTTLICRSAYQNSMTICKHTRR